MSASQRTWLVVVLLLAAVGGVGWWAYQRQFRTPDMVRALDLNNKGIGLIEQFQYDRAADAFRAVLVEAPRWPPGRINLGIALLNQDKPPLFEEAIAIFEDILKEDPKNNHAEFCLGIIRWHQGKDLAAAAKHFELVVQRDSGDPHAWFFLGNILTQLDEPDRARQCYEKVMAIDPYIPGSFNALQLLYRRKGDDKKADELLERMKQLNTSEWKSLVDKKYGEMGKYAEVIGRNPRDWTPASGPLPLFVRDEKLQVQLAQGVRWATSADCGAGAEGDLRRAVRKRFGLTMAIFDANSDGKLDLFLASAVVRDGKLGDVLLLNEGDSKFRDITNEAGLSGLPASL